MVVPVFYSAWQYECCGEPFSIDDAVEWPLIVVLGADTWMPESWTVEADLTPATSGRTAAVQLGPIMAYASDAAAASGRQRLMFYEDHHGGVPEDVPPARGLVRRIRVVRVNHRDGQPVRGSAEARDVTTVPDVFAPDSGSDHRSEVGLLLDLDVVSSA
jgi:hypothetical protein